MTEEKPKLPKLPKLPQPFKSCKSTFLAATLGHVVRCELPVAHTYPSHVCRDGRGGLIEWGSR